MLILLDTDEAYGPSFFNGKFVSGGWDIEEID